MAGFSSSKQKTFSDVIFSHQEKINDLSMQLAKEFSTQNVINYAIGVNNFAAVLAPYIAENNEVVKLIADVDKKLEFNLICLNQGIDFFITESLVFIQLKYSYLNTVIYQFGLLDRQQDKHPEEDEDADTVA